MRSTTTSLPNLSRYSSGDAADAHDSVGIFGVHVEDGNRQALRDVGREARRVRFARHGGEADQIVDDDVDGAADGVSLEVGEIQRFGPDALAGEGGVAMHDDRNDLSACLPSPRRVCLARARPMATGSTASRWLGFETR